MVWCGVVGSNKAGWDGGLKKITIPPEIPLGSLLAGGGPVADLVPRRAALHLLTSLPVSK